jgi:Lon-like ATP-dependent protease
MTDDYFGDNTEKWKWKDFKNTLGFPVSDQLIDWIIGQDRAMQECRLCIDEWVHKLTYLKQKKWWKAFEDPMGLKPQPKEWLPAGPFLLLLGDAGTGKSLIGRAMSSYMTEIYKKHKIKLYDVLSWKNKTLPSEPKISIHQAGKGKEIISIQTQKIGKKSFWQRWGMRILRTFLGGFGLVLIGLSMFIIVLSENPLNTFIFVAPLVIGGASLLFFSFMIGWFGKMMGGVGPAQGIGGAERSDAPKLLIDNSSGRVPYIDATGHGSAQLFGSIAWDPYQTGGLGTPEHQRVSAGDVHRAHLGILFIDEIKNLTGAEAITLLTVLEEGQIPIALRSLFHGGDTAAMAVSTEPVPSMVFFIAAGNLDSLPNIHAALLDRIQGYGKTVYMNNYMDNTIENRQKVVQFISQEVKRFNLLPFTRESCMEVIEESRRKSGRRDKLTTKFRPLISIIKTASTLARDEGKSEVDVKYIREAIDVHCKSIYQQVLERFVAEKNVYLIINPKSEPKIGQIYGLSITKDPNADEMMGSVLPIRASMEEVKKKQDGYFHITGVAVKDESYIQHSISKVAHIIQQMCGFSPFDKRTHIDFAQSHGIEGPSAGVAMTLALLSIVNKKKVRQDIAVTGEINIGIDGQVVITPIGGTHEKIMAAQRWGFSKVLIPQKNYENDIIPDEYKVKVVGCATIEEYMRELFID